MYESSSFHNKVLYTYYMVPERIGRAPLLRNTLEVISGNKVLITVRKMLLNEFVQSVACLTLMFLLFWFYCSAFKQQEDLHLMSKLIILIYNQMRSNQVTKRFRKSTAVKT